MAEKKEPILLSTDIGSDIDDALALLIMLNHPGINLQGIYTVNGDVNSRCYIAKRMVDLSGKNIPVGRGVSKALGSVVEPYSYFERYLIDDVYIDEVKLKEEFCQNLPYIPLKKIGVFTDGIRHMAEQLLKQPHVVFSIGPLTNIAVLLHRFPEAAANILRVYVMGFRMNGFLEHNIRYDSEAARQVLNSDLPLIVIPADLCDKYRIRANDYYRLESPVGRYVSEQLKAFVGAKIVTQCRESEWLFNSLKNCCLRANTPSRISLEQFEDINNFVRIFTANFDEISAYCERDKFLDNLQQLIELLESSIYRFENGVTIAGQLRQLFVQTISVADAFVPYCFLFPEKISTERKQLECTPDGETRIVSGTGHEVVRDIDFEDFSRFLRAYLR